MKKIDDEEAEDNHFKKKSCFQAEKFRVGNL